MGPNGSGKSTLAHAIMGDPKYQCQMTNDKLQIKTAGKKIHSSIYLDQKNITDLPTEERARLGLFLSFQAPIAIPGVSVKDLLRSSYQNHDTQTPNFFMDLAKRIERYAKMIHLDKDLLSRSIHEEFSGGERKKMELLQALTLSPNFALFDEIDTGVDRDALTYIAKGIKELQKRKTGIVLITHNERILQYVDVDRVLVLSQGKLVKEGDRRLIDQINTKGYSSLS